MKKFKLIPFAIITAISLSILGCGDSNQDKKTDTVVTNNDNELATKKAEDPSNITASANGNKWSQEQRTQFLKDCMSNAIESYKKRGETADENTVKLICGCAGQKMEQKYSYEKIQKEDPNIIKQVAMDVTTDCAREINKNQ